MHFMFGLETRFDGTVPFFFFLTMRAITVVCVHVVSSKLMISLFVFE